MGRFCFMRIHFVDMFIIWCYSDYVATLLGNKTCKLLTLLLCRRTWNFVLYAYGQANNNFFYEKAWHYGLPLHSNILCVLSIVTLTLMCYTIILKFSCYLLLSIILTGYDFLLPFCCIVIGTPNFVPRIRLSHSQESFSMVLVCRSALTLQGCL
jgi:hypothetical protein